MNEYYIPVYLAPVACCFVSRRMYEAFYPGDGDSHMKGVGMLVGSFELNP